jgi:hypothetical protein
MERDNRNTWLEKKSPRMYLTQTKKQIDQNKNIFDLESDNKIKIEDNELNIESEPSFSKNKMNLSKNESKHLIIFCLTSKTKQDLN